MSRTSNKQLGVEHCHDKDGGSTAADTSYTTELLIALLINPLVVFALAWIAFGGALKVTESPSPTLSL